MVERSPTKDELIRYAMKALDAGDPELAKKFMEQAEAMRQIPDKSNSPKSQKHSACKFCNAPMPENASYCKKCGKQQSDSK